MISVRRRAGSRLAATAAATALFAAGAIAVAGPATAEDAGGVGDGGARATLSGLETYDSVEVTRGDRTSSYSAGLFSMEVEGGGTVKTYCIDFGTPAHDGHKYRETGWDSSTLADNPEAGKIHWILQNSYPTNDDLTALADTAGADSLTAEQAAAGTQAAIWYYSDGVDAVPTDDNAEALADWLLENAEDLAEPEKSSLELSPNSVGGVAGEQLGPVTVHTSAESAVVTPDAEAAAQGVTLVDGSGEPVSESTPVADGTELYFDVPADADAGSTSLTASVTTTVPLGRAFTGVSTKTQTMILAGSTDSTVTANAKAKWGEGEGEEPVPSVTAKEDCVAGGVAVTVTNDGRSDYEFELGDESAVVAPGESETITVPVDNKQAYDIVVQGADGEELESFTGVLDCEVAGPGEEDGEGKTPDGAGEETESDDPDLAETGSSTNVGAIVGIAAALLVAGGAAVFFLRKKAGSASS